MWILQNRDGGLLYLCFYYSSLSTFLFLKEDEIAWFKALSSYLGEPIDLKASKHIHDTGNDTHRKLQITRGRKNKKEPEKEK